MASVVIPADVKRATWSGAKGRFSGTFNPSGKIGFAHPDGLKRMNPELWSDKEDIFAARLFVGFNVKDKPKWTMADLTDIVVEVRKRQVKIPDHSILYQKGVYTSYEDGKSHPEEGGQIIILNLPDFHTPRLSDFRAQMVELADVIIERMEQEMVIIEMQKNGYRSESIGVVPQSKMLKTSTVETE